MPNYLPGMLETPFVDGKSECICGHDDRYYNFGQWSDSCGFVPEEHHDDTDLLLMLNGKEFVKNPDGSYSLVLGTDDLRILDSISPNPDIPIGTMVPSDSTLEDAIHSIYSGSVLWVDGDDNE